MAHDKPCCCFLSRELRFRSLGPANEASFNGWDKPPAVTSQETNTQNKPRAALAVLAEVTGMLQ
jgi:hypothetical protein